MNIHNFLDVNFLTPMLEDNMESNEIVVFKNLVGVLSIEIA